MMGAKPPAIPQVTTKELQKWFSAQDKHRPELLNWANTFCCAYRRWAGGAVLSPAEIEFLAVSFTAHYDTPGNLLATVDPLTVGIDIGPLAAEYGRAVTESLRQDEAQVETAWRDLAAALECQLHEVRSARENGNIGSMSTLRNVDVALEHLREAAKKYSGTPEHRLQDDPDRDCAIYRMRRKGKTFGQIALALPNLNPCWDVTPNQAERAEKRYRERGQMHLLRTFRNMFSQPLRRKPR